MYLLMGLSLHTCIFNCIIWKVSSGGIWAFVYLNQSITPWVQGVCITEQGILSKLGPQPKRVDLFETKSLEWGPSSIVQSSVSLIYLTLPDITLLPLMNNSVRMLCLPYIRCFLFFKYFKNKWQLHLEERLILDFSNFSGKLLHSQGRLTICKVVFVALLAF